VGVGEPDGLGLADGDALGLAEGDVLADGEALGLADPDGEALGLADVDGLPLGDPDVLGLGDVLPLVGLGVGDADGRNAISGGRVVFGRAAKKRGGRLKVGTSSQNGACGSSAKYRLASGSAAFPLASIRKGPTDQSAGTARTRKKRMVSPAKNSHKPYLRRRLRSGFSAGTSA
jgi:hypothetical protein